LPSKSNSAKIHFPRAVISGHEVYPSYCKDISQEAKLYLYIQWNLCNPTLSFPTSCDI
jgi:hypothetical protein